MVTDRMINQDDRDILELSLAHDEYHQETTPEFFYMPGSFTKVYEDESGPILYVRGTKSLRLDVQFVNNLDRERNAGVMLAHFEALAEHIKKSGFTEICFNTTNPGLARFCKNKLGFENIEGTELRRLL
jgi:hypothetical protein